MPYPNQAKGVFAKIDMSRGGLHCWPWKGGLNAKGRPYYTVNGKKHLAYRLVYELVKGEGTLEGKMACHSCDNPICCNPAHITPGTQQSNMDEMKDRQRHGLPHHTIRAIRTLAKKGEMTHQEIADLYGIGRSTVTEMINGDNYSHVKEEQE